MWTRVLPILLAVFFAATCSADAQSTDPDQRPGDGEKREAPPPVRHTGWATLFKDTAQDFVAFPKRRSTWALLGMGAAGALATHPADNYVQTHIVGNDRVDKMFKPGKWIGATTTQVGTGVGLWVLGRYVVAPAADQPMTNKYSHLGFDLIRAQLVSQALVQGMKYSVQRDRPTGDCCAFPSGHAATVFAAAAVLERHLGYRASWPALVGATYVATSRLVERRHFVSDVVFGAAIGEAVGWTVVGRHGRRQFALRPVPIRGGMMVSLSRTSD
jgi:hypothetical protein